MNIFVTGSISFDQVMSMPGRFSDYLQPDKLHILNVSFLMETFSRHFGGTGANQAYTLALLGWRPRLAATVGTDFGSYRSHLTKAGVDLSLVKKVKDKTATGWAMTDRDNNQVWGFYSGAMKYASGVSLKDELTSHDWLMITPNDPRAMVNYARQAAKINASCLYDPAVQIPRFSRQQLQQGVKAAKIIIGNDYEVALLMKQSGLTQKQLLKDKRILISTGGAKGSLVITAGEKILIPIAQAKSAVDPTGAGDAYRAGFLAGYLKQLSLPVCGRMGALAAAYTVERFGTQTHHFNLTQFRKRYKTNFGHELRYS
ncbi:MAG: carbohydrate kinase family protein [Patescibacteria group bacterium]|nr:carbohydrate kinase family protein [Patescibacteria group bacterium]